MSSKRVLICGSIAFDTIMNFDGKFKDHILPDQVHILNVAFLVPRLRKDWGGCAGNIAYGLHMLGGLPVPMATVGHDAGGYISRFKSLGIPVENLTTVETEFTAQAFITTDQDDNQITAFHPGAMSYSHENKIEHAGDIDLGIIAPDGRDGMIQHAQQFSDAGIPFIFDPGQGLPMFGKAELEVFLTQATFAAVNDYEAKMLCDKMGMTLEQIAEMVSGLIVTRGAEGSWVFTEGKKHDVPCVKANNIVDPTGCGDAYRGGLLYGLSHGMSLLKSAKLASLMGSLKIAHKGGQNYQHTRQEIDHAFSTAFGETL